MFHNMSRTLTGPSVPLNQQFMLAPGEIAAIQGTSAGVHFLRVSEDSRCPADAFCVQGGDALVHIAVRDRTADEFVLHTGDSSRAAVVRDGLRIALIALQPYPFGSRTTDRSQPVLLKSIKDLSRFTAAEGNFQEIVDVQKDSKYLPDFLVNDRTLFVAVGSVVLSARGTAPR